MKEYYSIKEVQEIIGCGTSTVYKLVKSKGFPHIRIGRKIYVPIREFEEWQKKKVANEGTEY